ncbi:MAG TPA: porin [Steroidobacteraceae bacterium]|nr:porin [Steroidobacteraceae bacterium]
MLPRAYTLRVAPLTLAAATIPLLTAVPAARAQNVAQSSAQPSAQASPDDIESLERRLRADEQRLRELERKQHHSRRAMSKDSGSVRWGSKGLAIASADGSNALRLGALVQADGRYFTDSTTSSTSNTWLLRRVRPILQGTLDDIYDFKLMPDFGGGKTIVQDAFISARFKPWLTVTVGKFKPPVGLERLQSAADNRFIERGMPTDLVPNRDIGVQLGGDLASGRVNYSVGLFNGVADGTSSDTNSTPDFGSAGKGDVAARIFLRPFLLSANPALSGLGFGVAGTYVRATGSPSDTLLASYKTSGQQSFFSYRGNTAATLTQPELTNGTYASGERLRLAPQLYYYAGPVGLLAEYTRVRQGVERVNGGVTRSTLLTNSAWQAQLSWLATGEHESFGGVTPDRPFRIGGPGWGALELVARVQELTIDPQAFADGGNSFANATSRAQRARGAGIGVNWYLNRNLKWALDYELIRFTGGAIGGDRPDERTLFTRFQIAF